MENKETYLEFLHSESYKFQLDIWYKAYNISRQKTELFYDFLVSLYDMVDSTYLGEDILNLEEIQKDHFNWCWKKNLENFGNEKIFFKESGSHFDYLWNFFLEAYYYAKLDGKTIRISEYLYKLFDFKHKKSRSELDMLTEIYKMFEQNFKM